MTEQIPKIPVGTHYIQQEYLYSFASQGEILQYVRSQATDEDRKRLPDIITSWRAIQPRVAEVLQREAGLAETVSIAPVPEQHQAVVDSYLSDSLFQKMFSGPPVRVGVVEIDKLVASQRMVNLGYVKGLTKRFGGPSPTFKDLLEICVSPHREITETIQHLEVAPNAHVFSSPNSDIRFLGAFVKRHLTKDELELAEAGGLPAAAVIAFVGCGGAPVNALAADLPAGKRLILNNGFHRVYALRRLGVTHIPVVMQEVRDPQLEFPPQVAQLPREYLLGVPRPPLMKDFFEPGFTITLKVLDRVRVVSMSIMLNHYDVPL